MALTQVSTGGIKDGQVHTADLADAQITAGKLHADALDHTYTLGASGTDHYTFTGEGLTGAVNDPTLYLTRGKTYRFVNGNSSGAHPFRIQSVAGAGGTEYNTGVTNNSGAGGSTIIFEVPHDAPAVLYYICTSHAAMNGTFYVTGALADDAVGADQLASNAVVSASIVDGSIVNADINSSAGIAKTKLAALDVVNADVNASAAIAGSKISPDFGSQNVATTGTISDGKGNVRSIPRENKSSAYTLVASDAGKAVYISTGGVTLPASVMSQADAVTIINDSGSNQTLTQGSGLTLYNTGDATTGNRTLAGRGMATVYFASGTTAYISGSGLS